jgi:serine/threonine protein kinase
MLLFRDAQRRLSIKISDFGFASISLNEDSLLLLPKSRFWVAPEHHYRHFDVKGAKKMEVYSFGLLCFWLLIGKLSSQILNFDADILKDLDKLEEMKMENSLLKFTEQVLTRDSTLVSEQKQRLFAFFASVLALDPNERVADWVSLQDVRVGFSNGTVHTQNTVNSAKLVVTNEAESIVASYSKHERTGSHLQFTVSDNNQTIFNLALIIGRSEIVLRVLRLLTTAFVRV